VVLRFEALRGPLGAGLGAGCKKIRRPGRKERGRISRRYSTGSGRLAPVTGSSDGTAQCERERIRLRPPARGGRGLNYARRQQYRRLSRAGEAAEEASSSGCSGSRLPSRARRRLARWPFSRPSGWVSTRVTGSRSLGGVGSGPALRTPSSARWRRCRRRAGGCGIRFRGGVRETLRHRPMGDGRDRRRGTRRSRARGFCGCPQQQMGDKGNRFGPDSCDALAEGNCQPLAAAAHAHQSSPNCGFTGRSRPWTAAASARWPTRSSPSSPIASRSSCSRGRPVSRRCPSKDPRRLSFLR
jgi:hypothetical protein